jgi:octaprenyl-diphosphate synthase
VAASEAARAEDCLSVLPESPEREALAALAKFSVSRGF